VGVVSPFIFWL